MLWNDFYVTKSLMDFLGWKRVTVVERGSLSLKTVRMNEKDREGE